MTGRGRVRRATQGKEIRRHPSLRWVENDARWRKLERRRIRGQRIVAAAERPGGVDMLRNASGEI